MLFALGAVVGLALAKRKSQVDDLGPVSRSDPDRPERGGDFLMGARDARSASGTSTPKSISETYDADGPAADISPIEAEATNESPNLLPVLVAGGLVIASSFALVLASWISDYSTHTYIAAILAFVGSVAMFERLSNLWSDQGVRTLRWVLAFATVLATYAWAWTSPIWGLDPVLDYLVRITCSLLAGLCWVVPYVLDAVQARVSKKHAWAAKQFKPFARLRPASDKYLPWFGLGLLLMAALIEAFPIVQAILLAVPDARK